MSSDRGWFQDIRVVTFQTAPTSSTFAHNVAPTRLSSVERSKGGIVTYCNLPRQHAHSRIHGSYEACTRNERRWD